MALGGGVQGGVPGVTGGGLGAAVAAHGHGEGLDGRHAQLDEASDHVVGAQIGAGLQTVVHGDATGADAEFGGFEGEGGGERHGVGAAGAGDHDERAERGLAWGTGVVDEDVVEYAADRQAYRRDRRMGTHVRFPS